jgi:hypothetical protein
MGLTNSMIDFQKKKKKVWEKSGKNNIFEIIGNLINFKFIN